MNIDANALIARLQSVIGMQTVELHKQQLLIDSLQAEVERLTPNPEETEESQPCPS